jgi:hypothetical protein
MKHKIETYREQEIFYNEDSDKFEVKILTDEELQPKMSKRASLIDVKKSIDEQFKRNANFKPFKALFERYGEATEVSITSIRKDGGVVIEDNDGTKCQLHNGRYSDLNKLYKYSSEYLQAQRESNEKIKLLEKEIEIIQLSLKDKMPEKLDLSFINDYL